MLYRAVAQLLSAAVAVPVVATHNSGRVDALAPPADASSAAEVTATAPTLPTTRTADRAAGPLEPRSEQCGEDGDVTSALCGCPWHCGSFAA